jgi:hypothetical protein
MTTELPLIEKLSKLTKAGKVKWERGIQASRLEYTLPEFSVVLDRKLRVGGPEYSLTIIGNRGEIVDRFSADPVPEDPSQLEELYEMARHSATGTREEVSKLLAVLDKIA